MPDPAGRETLRRGAETDGIDEGMARIVVIGNAGGGKSTLSRGLAASCRVTHHEVDRWLWRPGWQPVAKASYDEAHAKAVAAENWLIDGLGRRDSIAPRMARATVVVLVDMPIWMHFWLAAERQIAWARGAADHPPAGHDAMPPTEALFRTMWEIDQAWMPLVRDLCAGAERRGVTLYRLESVAALNGFTARFARSAPA